MNTQTRERLQGGASPRPRVICHMAMSIDGRIVVDGWPDSPAVRREYEQIHATYDADAWMCGA